MTTHYVKGKLNSLVSRLQELDDLLSAENDYGEPSGYCNDLDAIWEAADMQACVLLKRIHCLKRRYLLAQGEDK